MELTKLFILSRRLLPWPDSRGLAMASLDMSNSDVLGSRFGCPERVRDIHILGSIITEAVATDMTLRSLLSIAIISIKTRIER
jgi:hypothetical protein